MKVKMKTFVVFYLFYLYTSRFCGDGNVPEVPDDCNQLSTIAYSCCYVEGKNKWDNTILKYCQTIPVRRAYFPNTIVLPQTFPPLTITDVQCGKVKEGAIPFDSFCGIDSPYNSTSCATSGGPDCCLFNYDIFYLCLKKYSYEPDFDYRYECSGRNITLSYILGLFFVIIIFIFY